MTSFQPLYGKLSDIFGRKQALLSAYLIFGVGALLCGLARDMKELVAARALAGVGGGGMTTVVSILLSDIVPLRNRGTWQGYINIVYAAGAGIGAPLGGLLADSVGWRWAFLGQAPLVALAIVSVVMALQLPQQEEKTDWRRKLRRVDFLGAGVLVAAVFGLLVGLDRGSNASWSAPLTIGCLVVGIVLFGVFMVVETKVASEPFAPGRLVFERSLFACYMCNFFSFAGWLSVIFYVPLFYQAVDGTSASEAGVRLLPGIVAGVIGSLFAGAVMQRSGRYYWLTVVAYTSLTLGVIPIILWTGLLSSDTLGIGVGLAIGGFGNGIGVTSSLIALRGSPSFSLPSKLILNPLLLTRQISIIVSATTYADQAVATACSYLFRSLGSVVGVSLSATMVQQVLRASLADVLHDGQDAEEITRRVRESLSYIKTLEPEVRDLVRESYGKATRASFVMNLCMVSGAMIAAFFIRERRLSR